jgi:hypothetical protein
MLVDVRRDRPGLTATNKRRDRGKPGVSVHSDGHMFEIAVPDPGIHAHVFTFG